MTIPIYPPKNLVHRQRLFFGICLALIPTGASFSLVSNILVQLKQQFILTNYQVGLIGGAALWGMALSLLVAGPLLEVFGLKNGARMAFIGHVTGLTVMISASARVGDPSAFWMLMAGAAILAAGNGMIEVAGNPLVASLYPDEKTKRLNWFHAFFPIGLVLGGIVGFLLATYGGRFAAWPYQLGVIYVPVIIYGVMVLPQAFPKTENAEVGLPVGDMFKATLTDPFVLMMLALMSVTVSMELGPMRWIPPTLQAKGLHGILVLVWISGWMAVLRGLSGHAVKILSPTGMLLLAATLTGSGLFLLSFVDGTWSAFGAATVFAWGVAFFFPTMVGVLAERRPKSGSLGIVLIAGTGLGMAGAVGVPVMGKLADGYLAESLPANSKEFLFKADSVLPTYIAKAKATTDLASLGFTVAEVEAAHAATREALAQLKLTGNINNDATANALRAVVGTAIPNEAIVGEAGGILQPSEAEGGTRSFRFVAPVAFGLILIFGVMFMRDKRAGGYKAERLTAAALLLALLAAPSAGAQSRQTSNVKPAAASGSKGMSASPAMMGRYEVLFLGDNGHHKPTERAQSLVMPLALHNVDLFYTDNKDDLNDQELKRYSAIVLYNNHTTVSRAQISALLRFVSNGGGLVVLHCASASFQNSEEFIKLVGAAFKSHGTGVFGTVRLEPNHPVLKDVPTWESWEETYVHTKHNPIDRTVLEVRRENGHDEPWTWVKTYGKGRVFYTAWGHDERTWMQPGFQQLVERGIKWTIGDKALTTVAKGPDLQMMDLEVPLPTYKRPPTPWNTLDTAIMRAQKALGTPQSIQLFTTRPKFSVHPFAYEPMIGNIIDFTWDAKGRMWAVETTDYPNVVLPDSVPGHDRILILEDKNGDGLADNVKVFAKGLNLATSLVLANGGVIVGQAPHMLFFKDTTGDDVADVRTLLFTGWNRQDTHGAISNLRYGFDNQILGSNGYNGFRGTVGSSTYERGQFGSGYYRFPADASSLDYLARTSNNTWGVALTEDGYIFGSTANSRPTQFVHIPLRYYRGAGLRDTVLPDISDRYDIFPNTNIMQVDQFGKYTAGAAHEFYTARAFPSEYWNRTAFVAEPTAHLIGQFSYTDNGSGFRAKNRWSFMASRDAWTAPVQVKVGPDGAVWVSDFHTLVAQHNPTPRNMKGCCETGAGAAYETPNRDRLHGRLYRIVYDSAPTPKITRLDNATPAQLVTALTTDNMFWRLTAQRMLVERKKTDVVPALIALVNNQSVDSLGLNVGALHALWTLQGLGLTGDALATARKALYHPAASVRRAALQMLPRDEKTLNDIFEAGILPDKTSPWTVEYTVPTSVLQDADAHVRLEGVLVLSEYAGSPRAAAALGDMIMNPENARDPWMPDATAIAGAKQGYEFVRDLVKRRMPANDTLSLPGIRRSIDKLVRINAMTANFTQSMELLDVAIATPAITAAIVNGVARGWPDDKPTVLSPEIINKFKTASTGAPQDVGEAFGRLAAKWQVAGQFGVTPRFP
jgi:putative membrane-bound dehydrogenase-like protein